MGKIETLKHTLRHEIFTTVDQGCAHSSTDQIRNCVGHEICDFVVILCHEGGEAVGYAVEIDRFAGCNVSPAKDFFDIIRHGSIGARGGTVPYISNVHKLGICMFNQRLINFGTLHALERNTAPPVRDKKDGNPGQRSCKPERELAWQHVNLQVDAKVSHEVSSWFVLSDSLVCLTVCY